MSAGRAWGTNETTARVEGADVVERPAVPGSKAVLPSQSSLMRWVRRSAALWLLLQDEGRFVRRYLAGLASSRDFAQEPGHLAVEIK